MPIYNNDCYGAKKEEIIKSYFLYPLANIRMLPHMVKEGCCGELRERFYIFSYVAIKDRNDRGTFYVGEDCALQIIEMVNAIKAKAGKSPLAIPQMFDISVDSGFVGGGYKGQIKMLNHDVLVLLLLLATAWDVQKFYGAPANILERIVRNPLHTIGRFDVIRINDLIQKTALFDTIKKHEREGARIGKFSIPYFNTVVDFVETEMERSRAKEDGGRS